MVSHGLLPIVEARDAVAAAMMDALPRFGRDLPNEPEALRHLLSNREFRLNGIKPERLRWQAHTINSANGNETKVGADLLAVLDIKIPGLNYRKAFLAQAKMDDPGRPMNRARLTSQCRAMLKHSAASYVLELSSKDVRVYPAVAVLGASGHLKDLYSLSLPTFMEQHFKSFLGDPGLVVRHRKPILRDNERAGLHVLAVALRPTDSGLPFDPHASRKAQLESVLSNGHRDPGEIQEAAG
jgi:hypothetical protein